MSERADDDVRGEQRKAARQPKQQQQQFQQGEGCTAMATVGERRSLPSPEIMLGQPWSNWVDAAKLHGNDGAESEESLKECGKNREAMRLCRDDMPIFGQCPAQDDFYLVMCSHCSQVVKPQAFQAHYERRHGPISKPALAGTSSSAYPLPTLSSRGKGSGGGSSGLGGGAGGGGVGRSAAGNGASSNSRILKPKEKLPVHGRPQFPIKVPHNKILTPAVTMEKMPLRVDASAKLVHVPTSSTTVSSPMKPGLNCPSIPKAPLLAPGQIPNGKSLPSLDKKQDDNASTKRQLHKRPSEREFNPDIHCGVVDLAARKPCTRSLTCKTHSLSQRRAVLGRRKRFDTLLAEHKSKAREKELLRSSEYPQQNPALRDPHPSPSRVMQDPHQVPHGNSTAADGKPSAPSKPKPHNLGLPRMNSSSSHPSGNHQGDPSLFHELPHHAAPTADGASRLSSDEGENEEKEEVPDKLDCHYSAHHPRPAAICSFGSRLFGRSCYAFDRRWDRVRCVLNAMVDKHVNSQMWKKIPPASEISSSNAHHKTSTNSLPASHANANATGFLSPTSAVSSPSYTQSLSYGTTLNARASPLSPAEHPAYNSLSRQVSSSPQMPSGHSAVPSPLSSRGPKARPSSKPFRSRETPVPIANSNSSGSISMGKKRKNSSPLPSHAPYSTESSSSSSSSLSLKRNCVMNSGGSGSVFHPSLASSSSSSSSSHSGVHSVGLNCAPGRTNSLSLKQDQSGRGPPCGTPAESIKRMSVVMNSSDSTLSLGPFVHQAAEQPGFSHGHGHAPLDGRLEGKRRKGSPGSSGINSGGAGGGGGGPGPGRPKMARPPVVNNIHGKHGRAIPGTQGLPNNSLIQQPKARP
ncbi:ataxin-7 isoform X2 [Anguilla anguilla]|nr:ataxin-7 isoform X2 [Anguilla anguilla]